MPRCRRDVTIPDELVDELLKDYREPADLLGESGIIQQMTQRLVERALAGELTHHLKREAEVEDGDDPSSPGPRNSRNGYSKKTVQADKGKLALVIPRDRNGEFEPILVPKHQRRLAGLDEKIIAMYVRGLSLREIINYGV
jgi:putative transposase